MKKIFIALGWAALFFLLFVGIQVVVSAVVAIPIIVRYVLQNLETMDIANMQQELTGLVLTYSALIALISNVLTVLLVFLIFKAKWKRFTAEIAAGRLPVRSFVLPVLLGVTLTVAVSMLLTMLPIPDKWMDQYAGASESLFSGNPIVMVFSVAIAAPVAEEVIFRGLILFRLRRGIPTAVAAVVSSLLFAVLHGALVWIAYAFLLGLALSFVCIRYRSITASIAVHMTINLLGVISGSLGELVLSDTVSIILLIGGLAGSALLLTLIARRRDESGGDTILQ